MFLIEKNEIKKLLEIIPNYPKINIFHLNDFSCEACEKLYEFCDQNEYDYDLFTLDEKFLECVVKFGGGKLDIKSQRYNKHSKLYDFIFIMIDFSKIEDKKLFLKKIYHICKNAAKILFFLPKKEEELEYLLEELNYVALNYIKISDNYEVLSAQKMHGWGVYDLK